ncbi:DUF5682 family protein [Marinactinospora rubrisoli]|uniref:DUF5682 family protein n=1 Tax=Marinactinospora rubrisoli TaxID=2715399 RepID=A0ABW2KMA4_9ACTN
MNTPADTHPGPADAVRKPEDGPLTGGPDPDAAVDALVDCRLPLLIGVRHHSPVLAAAIPELLTAADPDVVCVELPLEAEPWLPWLAHPDTVAPVALVVGHAEGGTPAFYPFADFSPELAAVRWAARHGVPVRAIDLPAGVAVHGEPVARSDRASGPLAAVMRARGVTDAEELWDRMVEGPAYGVHPGRIRRAALAMGWLNRCDERLRGGVTPRDLVREAWMRRRLAEITAETGARRPVAVVGSFHAAALLPGVADAATAEELPPTADVPVPEPGSHPATGVTTALIPYTFGLLDSRSGYPAGIRDPEWQQDVFAAGGRPDLVETAAARRAAGIAARLRADGHVAGVPDTAAAFRMARDLAALRGLAAPGRRELVEGLTSALAQGEPLGRARAVARAAHQELVGDRRGAPAPAAPASGLRRHVEALLAELGLPGPGDRGGERELRLDPLRSDRDRARHIALSRLRAAGVGYAEERSLSGVGGAEALGRDWRAAWRATTAATLELAACYGVTLEQAAHGRLAAQARADTGTPTGELTPEAAGRLLTSAAECALPGLVAGLVERIDTEVLPRAGLSDAVDLHDHVERIVSGQVPGMRRGTAAGSADPPGREADDTAAGGPAAPFTALDRLRSRLVESAVGAVAGVAGSTDPADAAALLRVVRLVQSQADRPGAVGAEHLLWRLNRLARDGGPLAQGAGAAALVLMDGLPRATFGARLAGWLDATDTARSGSATDGGSGGAALAHRLAGALTVASPVIEGDPGVLDLLAARVEHWPDPGFLTRLPALRDGFETLSTAARDRFLAAVADRLGTIDEVDTDVTPEQRAAWAAADVAARAAVEALLPGFTADAERAADGAAGSVHPDPLADPDAGHDNAAPRRPGGLGTAEPGLGAEAVPAGGPPDRPNRADEPVLRPDETVLTDGRAEGLDAQRAARPGPPPPGRGAEGTGEPKPSGTGRVAAASARITPDSQAGPVGGARTASDGGLEPRGGHPADDADGPLEALPGDSGPRRAAGPLTPAAPETAVGEMGQEPDGPDGPPGAEPGEEVASERVTFPVGGGDPAVTPVVAAGTGGTPLGRESHRHAPSVAASKTAVGETAQEPDGAGGPPRAVPGEEELPARRAASRTGDSGPAAALAGDRTAGDGTARRRPGPDVVSRTTSAISPIDRWRLILGRQRERTSGIAWRAGAALDELYGNGHGEGSRGSGGLPTGTRGGTEAPRPAAREWAAELEAVFGSRVREEVLGRAAARGRVDALLSLDPERVTPSVDLLEQVLALRGALPESHLARLRRLADRLIRRLTAELARRMRPALSGLAVPRPTRRPGGPIDLGRTVRANLHTARPGPDGTLLLVPERPLFRTRARRSADWHVHIVVDVSGSMERSTIYAALVASILHGLPALSVSFTAFSTEVMDLTDRVPDPLGLLLEVSVGGGTDIGAGLAHVRGRVRVPSRSIVALITDFEEGGRLARTLAEVRALAESGAHLLGLAALDGTGAPVYNRAIAERFVAAGMPVAALSPEELAGWIGEKVRG